MSEKENENNSRKNQMMSFAMKFLGKNASNFLGAQNEENVSDEIKILFNIEKNFSSTFGSTSKPDGFNSWNASLFKSLLSSFGFEWFKDILFPLVLEFLQYNERSEQCTAMEVISAALRYSKHWSFDENKQLSLLLSNTLKESLTKSSTESIEDWVFIHSFIK
jgi:hypothetical protein